MNHCIFCCREEESRKLVKSLQKQLIEVNKEKENEIQVCYYEWEMRIYKKWEITSFQIKINNTSLN